jgi:hypothetical protein
MNVSMYINEERVYVCWYLHDDFVRHVHEPCFFSVTDTENATYRMSVHSFHRAL